MSRRGRIILVGSSLAGLLIIISFAALISPIDGIGSQSATQAPRPPELGGQKVPDRVFDIRFDRRYDLSCSFYGGEATIYRNCTIVGFTGRGEESTGSGRGLGIGVFSSPSGSGSASHGNYFDHWLVLKLADGRLAYIPPGDVKSIEEASAKDE
jgi:hypothetical protein